jgi:hypothetical protein
MTEPQPRTDENLLEQCDGCGRMWRADYILDGLCVDCRNAWQEEENEPQPRTDEATKERLRRAARLIQLSAIGGDRNFAAARDLIATLSLDERRNLRLAVERLDDLLDADALDRHLARASKMNE